MRILQLGFHVILCSDWLRFMCVRLIRGPDFAQKRDTRTRSPYGEKSETRVSIGTEFGRELVLEGCRCG